MQKTPQIDICRKLDEIALTGVIVRLKSLI
jgi:hypothetical protein